MAPNAFHASFRWLLALTAFAALGLGCSKSKDAAVTTDSTKTAKISGKVTYSRIPLVSNDKGEPVGLETDAAKFTTLPARYVQVRLWIAEEEKSTTGATSRPWYLANSTVTDKDGAYALELTHKGDTDAFVELVSVTTPMPPSQTIRLIADPAGIDSALPQSDRLLYVLRKGVAGKLPEEAAIPGEKVTGDATVNFDIKQNTAWWLNSDIPTESVLQQAVKEPSPTGSRVMGILDSLSEFATAFGSASLPGTLDLHYRPGVSHARGSFIEYDLTRYPKAYSVNGFHFFGSLRGAESNDDAWDAGVIATLAAQNVVYASHFGPWAFVQPLDRWSAVGGQELVGLAPQVAFPQGSVLPLAAIAMKSPYLADTLAGAPPRVLDIRKVGTAPRDAFSAPNLQALAWEIVLKANSLPSPGTPADWAKIVPSNAARYFSQAAPKDTTGKLTDVVSVFSQLARLKEDKASAETVDLKTIFTDDAIKALATPFGLEWPRPTTGPLATFLTIWGIDFTPVTGQPFFTKTLTLSMSGAHLDGTGRYNNASLGETLTGLYATTKDQAYFLDVAPLPPAGVKLELRFSAAAVGGSPVMQTYDANTSTNPLDPLKRVVFFNSTKDNVTSYVPLSVHLVSPSTKIGDYTFTLTFRPAK